MNSKKAITLLVLVTLIIGMIPVISVSAVSITSIVPTNGKKGDTIVVKGDGVPAGYVVELYWDDVTVTWNGKVGKLNSTTAESAGTWEVWFDVPEAKVGTHNVWIKVPSGGETAQNPFTVNPMLKLSASSGLATEKVTVDYYGFGSSRNMATLFVVDADPANWHTSTTTAAAIDTIVSGETDYDGTLTNKPVDKGTLTVLINAVAAFADDGAGGLTAQGAFTGSGKINYVTGAWEFTVTGGATAGQAVTATYDYYSDQADDTYLLSTSGTTNDIGTLLGRKVTVPGATAGAYLMAGYDSKGVVSTKAFTIGAVISVDKDEVVTGDIIKVDGRGFTTGGAALIAACELHRTGTGKIADAVIIDDKTAIKTDGTFSIQIVMPDGPKKDDDYFLYIEDNAGTPKSAQADLEITALSEITLDPEYGPQGSRVSISGKNFPKIRGETVLVKLFEGAIERADIEDYETNADGTFSGTFRVPTWPDAAYSIVAMAEYKAGPPQVLYNVEADADFRIGTILVLLSDDEGPAGMKITLTGSGFTNSGEWNATFGDIDLFTTTATTAQGLLDDGGSTPVFYVPQVEPGEYEILVLDVTAEIEVVVPFTVTATTGFTVSPATMPSGFNVTITGSNWITDPTSTFTFTLYNVTGTGAIADEWDIATKIRQFKAGSAAEVQFVRPNDDGEIAAWWEAEQPDGTELDKGVYYLNVTDNTEDYFVQVQVTIGDKHIYAAPRKSTFRIGDTVSFVLQHSFGNKAPVAGGDLRVYDPDGSLYWDGDDIDTWTKVEMYYTAPISSQTAGNNPMILLDDAPLGSWTYKWREDDGDTIKEGSFNVEAAAADVIGEQIEDLNSAIDGLTSDISTVSSAVTGLQTNVNSAIQAANAAVAAANAATEAVNAVAGTASDAATAAQSAADAATDAQRAANGLTTLVYGAIGASLVAALAAIVSLMQISRRIAG
ncbi:hypothetical protein JXL21_15015 [Candidatus Bathyarchaeota archaeon]|nr:hypothetical protein [Candidatus Bathyarchaeota archaeon]